MKNKFLSIITDVKLWVILLIILSVRIITYSTYNEYSVFFDTDSYVNYEANIFKGEIDEFRTPIYPNIIKFVSIFNSDLTSIYMNVAFLQEIVSIISVMILYITLKNTFKNQIANWVTTVIYACFPAIFTYNKTILTESLSTSLFVIYFCVILSYIKQPTNGKAICLGIFTVFLTLLRPSFIYLIVAVAIIFILMFICKKISKKQAIISGAVLVGVCISIIGYCYANKVQNGFFGISNVTQINQLDTVIGMGIYKTGDVRDQGIIEIIDQRLDGASGAWFRQTTNKIMDEYAPDEVDAYLKRCIKNNFGEYLSKTLQKVITIGSQYFDEIYLRKVEKNIIQPIMLFVLIYIYIFIESIYILVKSIKTKKIPIEQFIMLIIILGQFATIIIGAQAEYSRLFITALPIVIISIGWHIEEIINSREKIKQYVIELIKN